MALHFIPNGTSPYIRQILLYLSVERFSNILNLENGAFRKIFSLRFLRRTEA